MTDRFLNGPGMNQTLADEKSAGTVNWYFVDNLGTTRDVAQYNSGTNTTSVVDHLKFDSFGNITAQSNSANQPLFAFTGQMWDSDVGLYWYHARWYDPHTGRFISQDPTGFGGGDFNLYRYVGNSSADSVDPNGLDGIPLLPQSLAPPNTSASTNATANASALAENVPFAQTSKLPKSTPLPGGGVIVELSDGTAIIRIGPPGSPVLVLHPDGSRDLYRYPPGADRSTPPTTTAKIGKDGLIHIVYDNGVVVIIDPVGNSTTITYPSGKVRFYKGVPVGIPDKENLPRDPGAGVTKGPPEKGPRIKVEGKNDPDPPKGIIGGLIAEVWENLELNVEGTLDPNGNISDVKGAVNVRR
jgi:RHS repeat-associated protein